MSHTQDTPTPEKAQLSIFDPAYWQDLAEQCEANASDPRTSNPRFWREQAAFCLRMEAACAEHKFRR